MADAQAAKKVHEAIQKDVKPLADGAFKRVLKAVPALNTAMKDLAVSIKNGDGSDVVETNVRALVIAPTSIRASRRRSSSTRRGWQRSSRRSPRMPASKAPARSSSPS
ncbi:MAG: hypothetical protein M3R22_05940 [Pseudomonadota bacterium]|nr:hypothetical protein [Pseudomonadota bacterium]